MAGRDTIHDRVYSSLRRAILNGFFKPGDSITLRQLAEEFDTSAMPIREAVKRLKTENTLEMTPTRRLRIPFATRKKLNEIYRARLINEGEITEEAARVATAKEVKNLKKIQTENWREQRSLLRDKKKGVPVNTTQLKPHTRFHFTLYGIAGNNTLLPIIESLWLQNAPALSQCLQVELKQFSDEKLRLQYESVNDLHMQIIDALSANDHKLAKRLIRADITPADQIADALGLPDESQSPERKLADFLT